MNCAAPAWTNAATTTTVFEHTDGKVVQEGPSTSYVPRPTDVGHDVRCRSIGDSAGGSATVAAPNTVSIVAAQLAIQPSKNDVVLSYSGAPNLRLRVTVTNSRNRRIWSRDANTSRRLHLPHVRMGVYRVCVDAPAAGQFASAKACRRWRSAGKA
jgi:hypothetical protein